MPLKVFMFLISTFVPSLEKSIVPSAFSGKPSPVFGRIEMLTSERMLPSSRLQSETPAYTSISLSADR